jgi:Fe-S-cluster-containing hydrogenase component 2
MPEKPTVDIYSALLETSKKRKKTRKEQLLESIGIKEFFEQGSIRIDMRTCKGVECKFCIKVCPTNALYWKAGEIGVTEDLCIYCTSCVLNCMVDDCIEVRRKRENGENERFSKPLEVLKSCERLNTSRRINVMKELIPDEEAFLKRYHRAILESNEEKRN